MKLFSIKNNNFKIIPIVSGIYLFYNSKKELVYVGKATNLRARVRSYFNASRGRTELAPSKVEGRDLSKELLNIKSSDNLKLEERSKKDSSLRFTSLGMYWRPIELMIHEVKNVKWKETDSVLEAIILEGKYIKQYKPKYNVDWKDDKSWNYVVVTKDVYPRIMTIREHEYEKGNEERGMRKGEFLHMFGPYPGLKTREMMKLLHRLFFISTCKPYQSDKLCRPCLYYEMGQCLGVCTGEISPKEYRHKVIRPLAMFLRGNKSGVIRQLEKEMRIESKQEHFEEAARLRNQIESLQRIQDVALLNKSFIEDRGKRIEERGNFRIEGYDISNLGSSGKVGSMVVFDSYGPVKSEYRKFKIKTVEGQSDVDCLVEILERRLKHTEWKLPDVILVDGGKPQVNRAVHVLKKANIGIPVVGIAKGPKRKKNEIVLGVKEKSFVHWVNENQELLIRVRDEAHRFAINYQKKLRKM